MYPSYNNGSPTPMVTPVDQEAVAYPREAQPRQDWEALVTYDVAEPDPAAKLFRRCCPKSLLTSSWWCPSYIADWLVLLLLAIADALMVTLWNPFVKPYQAPNSVNGTLSFNDNEFTFAHKEDTFHIVTTGVVSVFVPFLFFVIYFLFNCLGRRKQKNWHELHSSVLGICIAVVIGFFAWIPINASAGSFRPDFYERLLDGSEDLVKEGRKSFPSGHTVTAFLGLGFFSLWLSGKLRVFHSARGQMWRFFIAVMCPMALAIAQAVTRVTDNRHRTVDILGGAVLGIGAGICGYHLTYPPVTAPDCDKPKNRKWAAATHLLAGVPLQPVLGKPLAESDLPQGPISYPEYSPR